MQRKRAQTALALFAVLLPPGTAYATTFAVNCGNPSGPCASGSMQFTYNRESESISLRVRACAGEDNCCCVDDIDSVGACPAASTPQACGDLATHCADCCPELFLQSCCNSGSNDCCPSPRRNPCPAAVVAAVIVGNNVDCATDQPVATVCDVSSTPCQNAQTGRLDQIFSLDSQYYYDLWNNQLSLCVQVDGGIGWIKAPIYYIDEKTVVPTVSTWGFVAMGLIALVAGSVLLARRRGDSLAAGRSSEQFPVP